AREVPRLSRSPLDGMLPVSCAHSSQRHRNGDRPRRALDGCRRAIEVGQRLRERVYHLRIELRTGAAPQLAQSFGGGPGRPIGTRAGDRVEGIGDVDDTGDEWNLGAAKPVRVALSVRTLVVKLNDRNVRFEKRDAAKNP